eukprot:2268957-Rhodomonas_salina.3
MLEIVRNGRLPAGIACGLQLTPRTCAYHELTWYRTPHTTALGLQGSSVPDTAYHSPRHSIVRQLDTVFHSPRPVRSLGTGTAHDSPRPVRTSQSSCCHGLPTPATGRLVARYASSVLDMRRILLVG